MTRRRSLALVAAAVVVAAAAVSPSVGAGFASSSENPVSVGPAVDAGDLVLVDAGGTPLRSGNSETAFSLKLPEDATCPGDTAHDQWRWWAFVVPADVAVDDIKYFVLGPDMPNSKALYTSDGKYGADQFLLPNASAGEPGRFPSMPFFTYRNFPKGLLPGGSYRMMVTCTYFRETAKYWDTGFEITESDSDGGPAGFTWIAAAAPEGAVDAPTQPPFNWRPLLGALLAAAAAGVGFVLWRSSRSVPPQEDIS